MNPEAIQAGDQARFPETIPGTISQFLTTTASRPAVRDRLSPAHGTKKVNGSSLLVRAKRKFQASRIQVTVTQKIVSHQKTNSKKVSLRSYIFLKMMYHTRHWKRGRSKRSEAWNESINSAKGYSPLHLQSASFQKLRITSTLCEL